MQIRQILSEVGAGLRGNVSMTIALVVTTFVSLILVGVGLLVQQQSEISEDYFGSRLQIQITLCTDASVGGQCVDGQVSESQKDEVEQALEDSPEVASYTYQSQQQAYDRAREIYAQSPNGRRVFETVRPSDFNESYLVVLEDPDEFTGVTSAVGQLPGVYSIIDLRDQLKLLYTFLDGLRVAALGIAGALVIAAVLQVYNTIRMAAFARRREIGIMRLVGASSWHIQLPFVLEALLAAVLSGLLACGALALFMRYLVYGLLRDGGYRISPWVSWDEYYLVAGLTMALAVLVALIPTLVTTRKYLRV
jgi:cell division transport system permease protein